MANDALAETGEGGSSNKEVGGSSSIKCPMLTSSNYTFWSIRMKALLKVNKAWDVIDTGSMDGDKNDMAIALLFQSIPETLVLRFGELTSAKKVWLAIQTVHVGRIECRKPGCRH
ncbi:unnamed protein product [Microthlaspi erraticum]|uniref:DUF4219 domain-containing protein n=1 Tax=Microthlaspi erraticum TaxID=1685480 RepID=A0A6D2L1A4_9BRAS|nr:unnamed protein product [Microthlaspi erraticum]